ncbi:MAG: S-methyl-5-thioribose-1-phosphate isomerase [Gemmatimonadota bacterium]|nr:S-methyl-5-thioribose-1-phosphate isomerase [Gemmatimonadota bacterium]
MVRAVDWSPEGDAVRIIDQTLLPERCEHLDLTTLEAVRDAITRLAVRGAPAIGVAAAMAVALAARRYRGLPHDDILRRLRTDADCLRSARPTAVNLAWALDRMLTRAESVTGGGMPISDALLDEANLVIEEDRAMCLAIALHGLPLIPHGARVLTHCNAGALATAGIGTALAPVYLAAERGQSVEVIVGETRPLLQGSRLTAWELSRAGIPVTVVADVAVGSLMRLGRIDLVIVGADRISANGDVANKIGTYSLAVLARHHGLPFYVAAPSSTVDATLADGDVIPIEQRDRAEVARGFGRLTVPDAALVENPAFDLTPAELITAIVTDHGAHRPPYRFRLPVA